MRCHQLLATLLFLTLCLPAIAQDTVQGKMTCGKEKKVFRSVVARYVKSRHQVNFLFFDFKLKPAEIKYWKGIEKSKFPGRKWVAQFRVKFNEKNQVESYDATLECSTAEFFQRSGKKARADFGALKGTPGKGERIKFSSQGKGKETSWKWSTDLAIPDTW